MLESVCQVMAWGDETNTILYRKLLLLRLCSPVARRILPPGRESRDMKGLAISGLIVAEFPWNTTLNDTNTWKLQPVRRPLGRQRTRCEQATSSPYYARPTF